MASWYEQPLRPKSLAVEIHLLLFPIAVVQAALAATVLVEVSFRSFVHLVCPLGWSRTLQCQRNCCYAFLIHSLCNSRKNMCVGMLNKLYFNTDYVEKALL